METETIALQTLSWYNGFQLVCACRRGWSTWDPSTTSPCNASEGPYSQLYGVACDGFEGRVTELQIQNCSLFGYLKLGDVLRNLTSLTTFVMEAPVQEDASSSSIYVLRGTFFIDPPQLLQNLSRAQVSGYRGMRGAIPFSSMPYVEYLTIQDVQLQGTLLDALY